MKYLYSLVLLFLMAGKGFAGDSSLDIVGNTYLFDYGSSAYEISIESDRQLSWKLVKGEFDGPQQEKDNYIASVVAEGIVMLSWVENSGFGLSNILNLNTGELITHGRDKNNIFVNPGNVSLVEQG